MKYELVTVAGSPLKRLVCVAAFNDVASGEEGGWVENENNLSQSGNAWVYGNAWVSGNAQVSGKGTILCITNIGTRNATLTVFKTKKGWSLVTGCFAGTVDELESNLTDKHDDYRIFIPAIRAWIAMNDAAMNEETK